MHDVHERAHWPGSRRMAAWVAAIVGGVAVGVSQWHVLPPMVCFAVLVTGLVALGGAALLVADALRAAARFRSFRVPAAASRGGRPIAAPLHATAGHRIA